MTFRFPAIHCDNNILKLSTPRQLFQWWNQR